MAYEDVYLVTDKLELIADTELDSLEAWLSCPLPRGYRQFLTTLGIGTYCDFFSVLPPAEVRKRRDEGREYLWDYFPEFWEGNDSVLTLDEAVAGVLVASTVDGDEIYYCPNKKEGLFALPRHDNAIYWLEVGFEDPLRWRSDGGRKNVQEPAFKYFESWRDRRTFEFFTVGESAMRSLAESFKSRWSAQEVRAISDSHHVMLFPRAIRGRVQLTQSEGDSRVGIRVEYDKDCSSNVERFHAELLEMGFFEISRHPKD